MGTSATGAEPAEAEEAGLGGQLRVAVGRLYRRFRSERPEGSIGDAALEVLTYLHKRGPQTLTELSEQDRVSPASMSQTVNRLTAGGYAVRTRDPDDRRKVRFSVTADGDELARVTRAQRNAWLDRQLEALSPEDRAVIARATALLRGIADARPAGRDAALVFPDDQQPHREPGGRGNYAPPHALRLPRIRERTGRRRRLSPVSWLTAHPPAAPGPYVTPISASCVDLWRSASRLSV